MIDLVDAVANRATAARGLGDPNADRGAVEIHLFAVERDVVIGQQQYVSNMHVVQLIDRIGQVRQLISPRVMIEMPDVGHEPGAVNARRYPTRPR
jgi:hypothetical protein